MQIGFVLQALENLMQSRTVITITHRLRTISHADKIFVIQEGTVAETGTHEELIRQAGLYAQLYHIQDKEMPVAPAPSPSLFQGP